MAIADDPDQDLRDSGPRSPMHGIAVLLKDNIDPAAQMWTTAGSLALVNSWPRLALPGWLPGTVPVMVVLGPLLVAQYLVWIRVNSHEWTPSAYLHEDPLPATRSAAGSISLPADGATAPGDV